MEPLQILTTTLVGLLMLGLGATLNKASIKEATHPPKGILVGLLCQFGVMPLVAFCLALVLDLPDPMALSILLIGSTPGGATSNLFTHWSRGDVALSLSMTACSTVAAMGMMPLLLLIYASKFTSDEFNVPFGSILLSLALVLFPVFIGVAVRYKSLKWAHRLEIAASALGALFILVALVFGVVTESSLVTASWKLQFAAAILLLLGAAFGYGISATLGLTRARCRTVALETGIQNSTLTIAIIVGSFDDTPQRKDMLIFPLLYSFYLIVDAVLLTLLFRYLSNREGQLAATSAEETEGAMAVDDTDPAVAAVTKPDDASNKGSDAEEGGSDRSAEAEDVHPNVLRMDTELPEQTTRDSVAASDGEEGGHSVSDKEPESVAVTL